MAENRQTASTPPEKGDVSGVRNADPKREKLLREARERLSKVDIRSNGTDDAADKKIRERAMEFIATECLGPNFPEDRLTKLLEKIEELLKRKDIDVEKILAASKVAVEEIRKWLPDYDRKIRDIDRRIVGFGDDLTNFKKERDDEMGIFMKLWDAIASARGKEGLEKKYENLFNHTKADAVQEMKNIDVLLGKEWLSAEQKARLEGQKKLLARFQEAKWEDVGMLSSVISSVKSAPEHAKTAAYAATGVAKGVVMGAVDTVVGIAEITIMLGKIAAGNAEAKKQGDIIVDFIKENGIGGMAAVAVEEFSKEWARIQTLPKEEQTDAIGGMAGRVISIIMPVGGAAKLATTGARAAGSGAKWTRAAETAIAKSAWRGQLTPGPKPLSTPIPNASATARTAPRTPPLSTPVPTPLSTPVPLATMAGSANTELLATIAVTGITIPAQAKELGERIRRFERFDAILSDIGYPYGIRNLIRNDRDIVRVWTELFGANANLYAHIAGMDALREYLLPYFEASLGRMENAGTLWKEYSRLASGERDGQKNNSGEEWGSRIDLSNGYDQISDFYKKSGSGESIRISDSISVTKTGGGGIELRTPSGKLKFDPSEAEGAIQQLDLLNTAGAEFLIPAMKEIAQASGIDLRNGITRTESRKILSSLSNAFGISGISDEPDPMAMLEKFTVAASGGIDGKTLAAKARDPKMEILKDGVLNPKALVRAMSGRGWESVQKEAVTSA